jgi:hypothetical protein
MKIDATLKVLAVSMVLAVPAGRAAENLAEAYGPSLAELPDWSGVWTPADLILFPGRAQSVLMPDPAGDDGGFTYGPLPGSYITGVPYKPEYQALYDEKVRRGREEFYVDDPVGGCMLPHGMPRVLGGAPGPIEIVQTPKITYMIWDYMNELRRIYTDGRSHPPPEESWPTVMGHSIGHWEGQTLVVDTTNMMAGQFDRTGAPHSDQVRIKERITLLDDGRLEDKIIVEDPVMFTKPWEVTRYFRRADNQMINVEGTYCDNQRNPHDETGNQTVTLPGE